MIQLKISSVFICCLFSIIGADVSLLRYNRLSSSPTQSLQRSESSLTPYPARGYRPQQTFNLPREQPIFALAGEQFASSNKLNSEDSQSSLPISRPELVYGSPEKETELQRFSSQRLRSQRLRLAPAAATAAVAPVKLERLTNNREDQEDDDDETSTSIDIEVGGTKKTQDGDKKPMMQSGEPVVTYYPASAVGFVHPLAAYNLPTPAGYLTATNVPTASYYQPQFSFAGSPAQLQVW
ncbi:uncharacterized protein LOC119632015 [Glossina fuscipes]|uniref:Uncharacterized protein LOC119632015 n=2 Tax=Nemorhina TaxID=44051 RepID=A0A8U0W5W0_9MUSC|nr:uncharacterized protein LOC119632015 [Glossina fuscipes]